MGASLSEIAEVLANQHLPRNRLRVLDIGSQNLCAADEDGIVAFIRSRNDIYDSADLARYAQLLSLGSTMDAAIGGLNGAWLGDLLERAGIDYLAFDIFDGYRTVIFDLNTLNLPVEHRSAFDLVLNCGTTEHVLNQYNAFRVIHDAARSGGLMYHMLPMTGYLDHGYFNYQPRLFFELAHANAYELIDMKFCGPGGKESIVEKFVQNSNYSKFVRNPQAMASTWLNHSIPTGGLSVLLRKTVDQPFRASIETSTTAGAVQEDVQTAYGPRAILAKFSKSNNASAKSAREHLIDKERALVERLDDPRLRAEEIMAAYYEHQKLTPFLPFSLALERRSLQLYLEADHSREDLRLQLESVEKRILGAAPLMKVPPSTGAAVSVTYDGFERTLRDTLPSDPMEQLTTLRAAYALYHARNRAAEFPADLEYAALSLALKKTPDDPDMKVRLGKVLSKLTVSLHLRPR